MKRFVIGVDSSTQSTKAALAAMCRPTERVARICAELYEDYYSGLYPLLQPLLVGLSRRTVEREDGRAAQEEA